MGIGVPNPVQMLEVDKGDVYVKEKFYINNLPAYNGIALGPDKFRIVAIDIPNDTNSSLINGRLMEFSGNQEIMPIIIQPYHIKNISMDNLKDLNLNISTSKYVISLSNFQAIPINSSGIYRISSKTSKGNTSYEYDNFVIRSFESGGNWHVEIRAREADPIVTNPNLGSGSYEYLFDIILFPKRFFRNFGTVPYDLGGSNTGSALVPPPGI